MMTEGSESETPSQPLIRSPSPLGDCRVRAAPAPARASDSTISARTLTFRTRTLFESGFSLAGFSITSSSREARHVNLGESQFER